MNWDKIMKKINKIIKLKQAYKQAISLLRNCLYNAVYLRSKPLSYQGWITIPFE